MNVIEETNLKISTYIIGHLTIRPHGPYNFCGKCSSLKSSARITLKLTALAIGNIHLFKNENMNKIGVSFN